MNQKFANLRTPMDLLPILESALPTRWPTYRVSCACANFYERLRQ